MIIIKFKNLVLFAHVNLVLMVLRVMKIHALPNLARMPDSAQGLISKILFLSLNMVVLHFRFENE